MSTTRYIRLIVLAMLVVVDGAIDGAPVDGVVTGVTDGVGVADGDAGDGGVAAIRGTFGGSNPLSSTWPPEGSRGSATVTTYMYAHAFFPVR